MKSLKEIKAAYEAMRFVFDCKNTNWADRLLDQCKTEEKSHRNWGTDFHTYHPGAPSATDMARLFAVKRVAEYLTGVSFPVGKDYLHTQTSCFIAAGMVDDFRSELFGALAPFGLSELAELDYTDYVKVKELATA